MFPRVRENELHKMKCDIYEKDNVYYLEMDIPGFDKENVNIEIDDNDYLTITAEVNNEEIDDDDKNYIRRERNYGKYQRSFYVGAIDKDRIEASFDKGILKIVMPKKIDQGALSHRIEIK